MPLLRRFQACRAFVAVCGFTTSSVCAQTTFDLVPSVGYYLPTANFAQSQESATWLPDSPRNLRGVAVDVDARWWFHNKVGLQLQLGDAFSTIHFADVQSAVIGVPPDPNPFHSLGAQVQFLAAQVMTNVAPLDARYRVWLGIGPAVVHHAGDAYSFDPSFRSSYDVGAVVGCGGEIPIHSRLRATIGLESLSYWIHVDNPSDHHSLERGFQTDLMLHAGITWALR